MCLTVCNKLTAQIQNRLKISGGEISVWKYYRHYSCSKTLVSPFHGTVITGPGVIKATQPLYMDSGAWGVEDVPVALSYMERTEVAYGIHCFLNKEDALRYNADERVVELKANIDHLRAAGYFSGVMNAVFTQVTLSKEEFEKVFEGCPQAKWKVGTILTLRSAGLVGVGDYTITGLTPDTVRFMDKHSRNYECGRNYLERNLLAK